LYFPQSLTEQLLRRLLPTGAAGKHHCNVCLWPPTETASAQYVSAPNSKPHLMLARQTIVNADVRIASFRQRVDACNAI
jgi:hypothetical protein